MIKIHKILKNIYPIYQKKIFFDQNNSSEFFTFEIMLDKSTRGEHKIFVLCVIFWNSRKNKPDFQVLEIKRFSNLYRKISCSSNL